MTASDASCWPVNSPMQARATALRLPDSAARMTPRSLCPIWIIIFHDWNAGTTRDPPLELSWGWMPSWAHVTPSDSLLRTASGNAGSMRFRIPAGRRPHGRTVPEKRSTPGASLGVLDLSLMKWRTVAGGVSRDLVEGGHPEIDRRSRAGCDGVRLDELVIGAGEAGFEARSPEPQPLDVGSRSRDSAGEVFDLGQAQAVVAMPCWVQSVWMRVGRRLGLVVVSKWAPSRRMLTAMPMRTFWRWVLARPR